MLLIYWEIKLMVLILLLHVLLETKMLGQWETKWEEELQLE